MGETESGKEQSAEELYQQVMAINDFDDAVAFIQSLPPTGPRSADNSTKLRFYSYFKPGSVGPCKKHGGPQPWLTQVVNRAKWDAWNALGDMPSSEAKTRYVIPCTNWQVSGSQHERQLVCCSARDYQMKVDVQIRGQFCPRSI